MKTANFPAKKNRQLVENTGKITVKTRRILRNNPRLELFQKEDSPSSHAVRTRLSAMGVDYIAHNLTQVPAAKNGRATLSQVKQGEIPLLIDHKTGTRLQGSRAILAYLEKEYGTPRATRLGTWIDRLSSRVRERADALAWMIRTPTDRVRLLADEVSHGWKSFRGPSKMRKKSLRSPARGTLLKAVESKRKAG